MGFGRFVGSRWFWRVVVPVGVLALAAGFVLPYLLTSDDRTDTVVPADEDPADEGDDNVPIDDETDSDNPDGSDDSGETDSDERGDSDSDKPDDGDLESGDHADSGDNDSDGSDGADDDTDDAETTDTTGSTVTEPATTQPPATTTRRAPSTTWEGIKADVTASTLPPEEQGDPDHHDDSSGTPVSGTPIGGTTPTGKIKTAEGDEHCTDAKPSDEHTYTCKCFLYPGDEQPFCDWFGGTPALN